MKESWLIFCDYEGDWKGRFLKKGFNHLFILTKDNFNWYVIDPDVRFLNIKVLPLPPHEDAVSHFRNKHKMLYIKYDEVPQKYILNMFRPFTCVEVAKYILGLKVFCFTPYQLFKKLKKMGAETRLKRGIDTLIELTGD